MELNKITLFVDTEYSEELFEKNDLLNMSIIYISDLLNILSIEEYKKYNLTFTFNEYALNVSNRAIFNIARYIRHTTNTLCIQYPETALSERLQQLVVKHLLIAIREQELRVVLFINSAIILNEFLVAIKEKLIMNTDITIYFTDKESKIISVPVLEHGRIIYPPEEFFSVLSKQRKILMGF